MTETGKRTLYIRFRSLLRNGYFWKGAAVTAVVGVVLYILFNYYIMPTYTRHGVSVAVPNVLDFSFDDAVTALSDRGLLAEEIQLRKPNLPRNVVIDQNPPPDARVKPGRRIYVTVNSGDTTTVLVPPVEGFSIREARNRINIQGLAVQDVFPDSIPSAHANTITRQLPAPGERVPPGSLVRLWYSTGLGDRQVAVPDVVGMKVREARRYLLGLRLRSAVIGNAGDDGVVRSQSPAPGTSVREGFEIRLRIEQR